jgi:hypothetical protein
MWYCVFLQHSSDDVRRTGMTELHTLNEWLQHFRKANNRTNLDALIVSARRAQPSSWTIIEQAAEHREAEINQGEQFPIES